MRKELKQISDILELIQQMIPLLEADPNSEELRTDIMDGVAAINLAMFGCEEFVDAKVERGADGDVFLQQVDRWSSALQSELHRRDAFTTKVDYDFYMLTQHVRLSTKEELVEKSKEELQKYRKRKEMSYQNLIKFYNLYSHFWGKIDLDRGIYELLNNRIDQLKEHLDDFIWLYGELADYRSKKVLYGILRYWMTFDFEYKRSIKEYNFADYWDFDLFCCDENEVVVDVGAFNGDSALSYIENFRKYKRIYCYEITPSSYEEMEQRLSDFDNIILRNVGVGDKNGEMYIADSDLELSSNRISEADGKPVQIVRLDDDIQEPVTLIKMDIEGSELAALEGAKGHIQRDKPKLAICTYHNNHHIWEIPRWMKEVNPEYKLYMRYNGSEYGFATSEFVTFAL